MRYIFILFFTILISHAFAQEHTVQGIVKSADDGGTLPGATVLIEKNEDSTIVTGVITNLDGAFRIENLKPGEYNVKVQFLGYRQLIRQLNLSDDNFGELDLGTLLLQEEASRLDEVVIKAKRPVGVQKGDTTQFNADSFTTLPDASGQDLLEKMPGITVQDGALQAQGENIVKILVDGKPFFGNDVNAALQNLPAEVIQSIEVFDQKSDKALLSGFDDGEREKTINIVTKPNRRKGQFGKGTAGYGTDGHYMVGASVNLFNEDRRITITGLSNNVNAVNYSADPNSQGESRTQNGIINTNTLGINFTDNWGNKIEVSGSYLFSHRENEGRSSRIRDYILSSDSGQVYTENRTNTWTNLDHRFNMRFEYNIDKNNRVLIRPNISLRHDDNSTFFLGRTVTDNGPLNQTENTATSNNSDYDFSNRLYYSHKFQKPGRSLTLRLNTGFHSNEDEAARQAKNIFYREVDGEETINQRTTRDRTGLSWEADLSYTEPMGRKGQVELEYEVSNRLNDSDKRTYDILDDQEDLQFYVLDTALSNFFQSEYLTQEAELGYQYSTKKIRVQVEGQYQNASLKNDQVFPQPFDIDRTFGSFLPTVRFDYEFSESKNIEIDYDTWTDEPSIGQLQDVVDNSNPLHLRTGNPDLDQSFHNRVRLRYRGRKPQTEETMFLYMATSIIKNNITNSTMIADEATEIAEDVVLERGSQLSQPVNIDGYWDFRSYISYGRPFKAIKSNISVNASYNYTARPGMVNGEVNFVNSANYRAGLSLSSNISEKVDFNISTRSSYNLVRNSMRPEFDNTYFNQTSRFSFDWIFWKGFIFRLDMNHQLNTGLADAYDNSFTLLNLSVGKKFLPNDRGEISLNVFDLLGQNNNIDRNITELYIEDVQSNVLQRYFMLTFTYNLRHFSKGTTMKDYEELHE